MTRPCADTTMVDDQAPATAQMRREVLQGLRARPKRLPQKYLYDERGAALFEEICEQPEYYIPRIETRILRVDGQAIAAALGPDALLIEPGSGSGIKTRLLLERARPVAYVPIDISLEQLARYSAELARDFPTLEVLPVCADFLGEIELPEPRRAARRTIVFIPGSTIGNFTPEVAVELLRRKRALVGAGGALLLGVDLKKEPALLEPAYDDAAGVSAEFALNVLRRLNEELGGNLRRERFGYKAVYNESEGRVEMNLVSLEEQAPTVAGTRIPLSKGERIRTEFSYKYTVEEFAALAGQAGLTVRRLWTDPLGLFSVQYLTP